MNVLTIIGLLVVLIFMFQGYRKGFVKVFTSMVFFVAVAVLVFIVNPYVSEFLKENTPIYKMIQENIEESFVEKITERQEAAPQDEEEVPDSEAGTIEEDLAMVGEVLGLLDQKELIEELNVPEILKKNLINNNNEESYADLYVTNFVEYISAYIATAIVNIISYVVTVIIVIIVVKTAIMALDAAANLPAVQGVNRLMGVVIGFGQGVMTLWFAFLIITIFSQTEIGKQLIQMIIESPILNSLYNYNIFLKYLL